MKKQFLLLFVSILLPIAAFSQSGSITGKVIDRISRQPIQGAQITLQTANPQTVKTDAQGVFNFYSVEYGNYNVDISMLDYLPMQLMIDVRKVEQDMGTISLSTMFVENRNIDDFTIDELDTEFDDEQSMPSILSASKDVYDNVAGFKFSSMRFRTRGYDSGTAGVYLNGIYFNDALTGYNPWSLWSGLNDATRTQEVTSGAKIADYGVGGINGSTNIYATASKIRKGGRVSFVNSSGQYRYRVMATYGSGLLDNGWAYAVSVSTRQGGNSWTKGTYYDNWGYFASVEKNFANHHNLALTVMGTPGERAIQGASTQEVYDLVGSNTYNPNWGYQDGKKRNARVRDNHEPIITLNYNYEPNAKFNLASAFSFRFGKNGYSALDWHGGQDPRPDYYRNLPSYFLRPGNYYDPYKAALATEGWKSDWNIRQINWDKMYHSNRNSYFENDGTQYYNGVDPNGKRRSEIVLQDRRTDQRDFRASINFKQVLTNSSILRGGFNLNINRTEYFTTIKDLLGGDYYLDIDKYVERDQGDIPAIQSNMNTPNRLVGEGDKYGYDYYGHVQSQNTWLTYKLSIANFEIDLGGETGFTRMWREGLYKKGLFPDNSEGNSEKKGFWTYTAKVGINYRISGSQMVYANFARIQDAPQFKNAFVSPRTRNEYVSNLSTEKTTSVDLNYELRLPSVKMRLSGFYTDVRDKTNVINFYDDLSGSFTNFSMSGIDELYTGLEFGISVPITRSLTATGVFSYGYYKYNSNPYVTQTRDNSAEVILKDERVRWKDMKIAGTPQTAASIGLNYRGPKNIYASIDGNFFDAMYLSMNPMYRTDKAMQGLEDDPEGTANWMSKEDKIQEMAHQERFGRAFVFNVSVGKSWRLPHGLLLGANLDVRNIFNRKSIKTGGYEQMRFSKMSDNGEYNTHYSRFDSKYYYMYGTTYYLNVYLRF